MDDTGIKKEPGVADGGGHQGYQHHPPPLPPPHQMPHGGMPPYGMHPAMMMHHPGMPMGAVPPPMMHAPPPPQMQQPVPPSGGGKGRYGGSAAAQAASGKGSGAPARYKKAPDAPKRFKSAFIIFSAEKHKEIKESLFKEGKTEKTTDIAKRVSEAWREMKSEDKEEWEQKARKDKARYEVEKSLYKGPWKVPANKRTPKDPSAPKRPMSAFLAFSNKRRAGLKRSNPNATNADLSKMLSKQWKEADDDIRHKYMDEEAQLRAHYKEEMAKWRKKVAEEKKAERKEREAMAMQAAEAGTDGVTSMGAMPPIGGGNGGQQGGGDQPSGQDGQGGGANAGGGQGMYPYGGQQGGDANAPGQGGFNPGFAFGAQGGPGGALPGAAMQLQLSQLLAGQQFMQNPNLSQRGGESFGVYGQGLPNQGGQGNQQQMQSGMNPNADNSNLAGFGSNMPEGQQPQGQGQNDGFNPTSVSQQGQV